MCSSDLGLDTAIDRENEVVARRRFLFTEALEHELRNIEGCKIHAHLLIPGFVFTDLTKGERTEKPAAY